MMKKTSRELKLESTVEALEALVDVQQKSMIQMRAAIKELEHALEVKQTTIDLLKIEASFYQEHAMSAYNILNHQDDIPSSTVH